MRNDLEDDAIYMTDKIFCMTKMAFLHQKFDNLQHAFKQYLKKKKHYQIRSEKNLRSEKNPRVEILLRNNDNHDIHS